MTRSLPVLLSSAPTQADQQLHRADRAVSQPRLNVHQLERFTPRFDELVHRAGLAQSTGDVLEVEEALDRLCRDMRAVLRSPTPQRPPLRVTKEGAIW
ncbi:hypothetical protein [Sphingomonas sp. BK580]|uniref:hypothetical protein n=1 Tax=Sphingomonas sp. BK580 TaxID=2586972 RepID=UPI001620F430|nr:hypothetical protein [Sphingomonas sp. BK580]MBB3691468.1 hypothetical protein [Sphingomonas sp. BK580]